MRIKKTNAILGLLSILLLVLHLLYSVFAYLTFYYNPIMKWVFAVPLMIAVCLHAVLGMLSVSLPQDGGRMDLYPKQNRRTILQRVSAALIFPLLILHINTFSLMQTSAERGLVFVILLLIAAEIFFFAVILTHIATSLTKALITLGLLSSEKTGKILDRIVYILCAVFFLASVYAVVKGQLAMFF